MVGKCGTPSVSRQSDFQIHPRAASSSAHAPAELMCAEQYEAFYTEQHSGLVPGRDSVSHSPLSDHVCAFACSSL